MKNVVLIHKADKTWLPTTYPAYYYGAPDSKIYIIYAIPYQTLSGKSGLDFVIARHEEFAFDYKKNQLISLLSGAKDRRLLYNFVVDNHNPQVKIIKITRSPKTYGQAERLLNKLFRDEIAKNMKFTHNNPHNNINQAERTC